VTNADCVAGGEYLGDAPLAMPFLGRPMRFLLLGGNLVGENALLRFYVLHCVILPLITVMFVGVHFWRIQKDGGLTQAEPSAREEHGQ
jgi:quinol-cytochrome oxidoreductase complex cytochrome b subunit